MWNDKETDIDLLDHEKIAQTVLEIVGDSHLRPLTIGIYGDWGVGKSKVISLLQREIETGNKNGTLNAHAIMFNGWLFQGYEDAKTALMETVVLELAKLQPKHKIL
jgi:predicted KAP-like P-loop ATPase